MRDFRVLAVAILLLSGCQQVQVRKHSDVLSGEFPEMYYEEVLDNIALACAKPDAMPYFGTPAQGTSGNTRQVGVGYTPSFSFITSGAYIGRFLLTGQSVPISANNQDQTSIQVNPVIDPDRLELLRIAFHLAAGGPVTPDERAIIEKFYTGHKGVYHDYSQGLFTKSVVFGKELVVLDPTLCNPCNTRKDREVFITYYPKPQWCNFATNKKAVPKCACHVGEYCNVYVWVDGNGMADLREFTMSILDILTVDLNTLKLHSTTKASVAVLDARGNQMFDERRQPLFQDIEINRIESRDAREPSPIPYPSAPNFPIISPQ